MKKKIILIIYELNKFQKIFYNLFYIMKFSVEKFYKDFEKNFLLYTFLIVILILGVYYYYNYINKKSKGGYEGNTSSPNNAYSNNNNQNSSQKNKLPQASQPLGQNEVYSSVNFNNNATPMTNCNNTQNPSDLLPKDTNSNWASLNPQGNGDLQNINLLKSGYHLGIDTIGQTLKNANLQIRSEPPNPQVNTGPWNQSTITPDFMRPPLEIGCGSQ